MKDQYVGDHADFAKYALLRALASKGLTLGIAWMKTPPASKDGGDVSYLKKPDDWRKLDPDLFDVLKGKVDAGQRDTGAVGTSGILSPDTTFFGDTFTGSNRNGYFAHVAKATVGKDVLFLDPDNGIGTGNTTPSSEKHVLRSDLKSISTPKQSMVIFQHYSRGLSKLDRCSFANDKAHQMFHCMPAKMIYSVRGKKTALLVAVMEPHEAQVVAALKPFQQRWEEHLQICKHTLQ